MTAPQRFLANDRNLVLDADLVASSVLPVANGVLQLATARSGTGQVTLGGTYTASEEATYEVEIVDTTVDEQLVTAPIFSGVGSGTLKNIVVNGAAQAYTLEMRKAGTEAVAASIEIEGVTIKAAATGVAGNALRITVDQSGLTFSRSYYSTLTAIAAGSGGPSAGFSGAGFDWDSAPLNPDGTIPTSAHRIAFGDDETAIHVAYKQYVNGSWSYHLAPAATRDIPAGTAVKFVTGSREIGVTNGTATETLSGIVTTYDFLHALKLQSSLLVVDGVVANDRTPTGQAARELTLRTDAHAEASIGSGGYATGFADVSVGTGAQTELITATCFGVTSADYPLAALGAERWQLAGSLSGDLGVIATGIPYREPSGKFSLTIPVKLPPGFGTPKGRFSVSSISYASRSSGETEPPICPVSLALGPNAVDQTITLTYTARPSGDCDCSEMAAPALGGPCLGNPNIDGGADMTYQADTVVRLKELYDWYADTVRAASAYAGGGSAAEQDFLTRPAQGDSYSRGFMAESLGAMVGRFESAIALIDALPDGASGSPRADGMEAWDVAVAEMMADLSRAQAGSGIVSAEAVAEIASGMSVEVYSDIVFDAVVGMWITKWFVRPTFNLATGFVTADYEIGDTAYIHSTGILPAQAGETFTVGKYYYAVTDGAWSESDTPVPNVLCGRALSTTEAQITEPINPYATWMYSWPSDRYKARLDWALISAGISPLGKSDASTLQSGDGCWRDSNDANYWTVVGSVTGAYAPLFTNTPYYSCRATADKVIFSTHEFALQLNVKCDTDLKIGDTVTLVIQNASWGATYQRGDKLTLPIIAAGPAYLRGGDDGDSVQEWYVSGSIDGPLPMYEFDSAAPEPYAGASTVEFELSPGGIPFAKGDRFRFGVEGGHYRWRRDGGAWSASAGIPVAATSLDAGLTIAFATGAGDSFSAGDVYSFRALQPWALSNVKVPTFAAWQWSGSSATLDIDLGSEQVLDTVALLHSLPAGATITLTGGAGTATEWTETLIWRAGAIWKPIDRSARFLTLLLTGASSGALHWLWLGKALATSLSADMLLRRSYAVARSSAKTLQSGLYLGRAVSGEVQWSEGALSENDVEGLAKMLDWVKEHDDEPILVIPQVTRTDEPALLARINADDVDLPDIHSYQPRAGAERRLSATIPLAGVWR